MTPSEYIKNVLRTEPKKYFFGTTNNITPRIEHAVFGIVTESGELMSQIKRAKIYGTKIDKINLIEELGDCMWYYGLLCDELGISFEEVWEKNIAKLQARFPEKYKKSDALKRNLKKERKILEK
ncbi:MAG: hypothetical protein A2174_02855 [Candidatus Portnoybacteria bacterium RBG_13_41_18]|uniref:NTP pyrophosphohydrolase MazG-like domain-containing protein n=1 Tax=Candidatus Portnoybacteria bacterium RBG_13_41_18 TaxID=1801991 RepID=A0A1G2F9N0_9BACT|nr:MAG: hypothetical protein A2174_02855 [Candidatus Portnoybacteria bacterium RBG_13_41_18]